MTITVADLKIYQSERMADTSDGGGRMSAIQVVSGAENQIFDDVSDVDRASGDVSIRKVFAAVTSADTDKYLDAGVAIVDAPDDPAASVLAFSTGNHYDERAALQARIEQTITRGPRFNGYPYGQHLIGQRALLIWQRPDATLPPVGMRLELIAKAGTVEQSSQFLWVTRVMDELRTMYDDKGPYLVRVVTCELAEALTGNYLGPEPSRADPSTTTAILHETRYNAEAVPMYGIRPIVQPASIGDFGVQVDSLYSPLIPTAFAETALPDVTPGADTAALIAGNSGNVSFTTTTPCVKPDGSLFLGTACTPGTLSIAVSGSTITDDNGAIKLATTTIGSIDYGNGIAQFNVGCPNYGTATKTITFKPAGRPLQVADTAAQHVTAENRGFVWVITLSPIPAPGTLKVAYRVNNQWYVLNDLGGGLLRGVDSSYGSGNLNFATGTATISTGALPDVDSDILYAWGTPALYTARGGSPVDAPIVRGQTAHPGVAPNSVTVTWMEGAITNTLTDDGHGVLSGTGGTGAIRYATGDWLVRPGQLPAKGTVFTITYDWGAPYEKTFAHPARLGNGHLALTLDHPNVRANTVEVEWNLLITNYDTISDKPAAMQLYRPIDPIRIARDNGLGALPIAGGTSGTVNYAAGTLDFLPDITTQIPEADYSVVAIGTSLESGGTKPVYRNAFTGFSYKNVGASFPIDESGWVKVRYRVTGGDTTATETATLEQLEFDLTKGYAETIVPGSVRFRLGASLYVDIAGQIYRDPSPDTGAGALAGSLDPVAGRVRLAAWAPGGNSVALESLVTSMDVRPLEEVVFRTPTSPLKSGTLQLRFTTLPGVAKSKTVDGTGKLEDADCLIRVDYPLGIVRARFGSWKNDADLTPAEKLEPWYSTEARVDFAGTLKIWKPKPVLAASIVYNAVAQTFLPPDSTLLGLNAARLPPDGKALIFNTGRLVLIHHTARLAVASLSPTQQIDCGRVRLYRAEIEDSTGKRLGADQYTINRELGTLTMSPTLNLTGFIAPYTAIHTVADLARLVKVDINGTLQINKPLSHAYPANTSCCSGVLPIGTMQARVSNLFAQSTWGNVWSDTLSGSAPLAQYNNVQWPIIVSNLGAYTDRILVLFTNATAFNVIGERLGFVASGTTATNCAPINTLTEQPYFTIDYRGWGSGWAAGNCLRFNLIGANYPVDLVRAIQPSEPTGQSVDRVEVLLVGNVDA